MFPRPFWPSVISMCLLPACFAVPAAAQTSSVHHALAKRVPFGPPLPPHQAIVRTQAQHLLMALARGQVRLDVPERETAQLHDLERDGLHVWPRPTTPAARAALVTPRQRYVLQGTSLYDLPTESAHRFPVLTSRSALPSLRAPVPDEALDPCVLPPSPLLLRMLTTLAAKSSPGKPLQILSLLRPPYRVGSFVHVGAANPHSLGLAVDVSHYGGYAVTSGASENCVHMMLAVLRDLPPGRYRLGVPKAPEPFVVVQYPSLLPEACAALRALLPIPVAAPLMPARVLSSPVPAASPDISAHSGISAWPFFPPPEIAIERAGATTPGSASRLIAHCVRFQNEDYAPESELHDPRLKKALAAARLRGVNIIGLFPDGADHLHIDVRQNL